MTYHNGQSATAPVRSVSQGRTRARRTTLTDREIAYLSTQRLGRIATVDPRGRPRLVTTGFSINAQHGTIELGGHRLSATRRVNDIRTNPHVSLIIDNLHDSSGGWNVRGVEIRGTAAFHASGTPRALTGNVARDGWMEITPTAIRSWGLD